MTMGYVAAAVVVASAVVADRRADKVADAQDKQADLERAIGAEKGARARREQRAKAQVARAEVENQAASSGQGLGSAAIAGGQGITAQAGSNIAAINTSMSESNLLSNAAQDVADASRIGLGERLVGTAGQMGASYLGGAAGKAGAQQKPLTEG